MQVFRRLLVLFALLAGLVSLSAVQGGPLTAVADAVGTVQGCTPASGGSATCTVSLNLTINPGGAWKVTLPDPSSTITACDASASGATCTTAGNSATVMCPSGCQANSKYSLTVSGPTGSAPAASFVVLNPGVPTVSNIMPTTGGVSTGTTTVASYATTAPVTTAITQPVTQVVAPVVPAGGQCVNSVPTYLGCSSIGPSCPLAGCGYGYAGLYGGLNGACYGLVLTGCGGSFNCGIGFYNGCGSTFNCGVGFFNSGCGNSCLFSFGCSVNNGCLNFTSVFCPSNCTPGLFCGNVTNNHRGCWNSAVWRHC